MMLGMNLSEHIKTEGGTGTASCPVLAAIAGRAGCSAGTLYMISLGHKKPSGVLSRSISDATQGAVSVHELRPDVFGAAPAANAPDQAA